MSTAGGMLTRDLYKKYLNPKLHATQKLFGRMGVAYSLLSTISCYLLKDALVLLGGLAVAFGFQMGTVNGFATSHSLQDRVTLGMVAGIVAVMLTESIGVKLFGDAFWGRWLDNALCILGMFFNLGTAIIVSAMTQMQVIEHIDRNT